MTENHEQASPHVAVPRDRESWPSFCDPLTLFPGMWEDWEPIPVEDALDEGLTPCSTCFPEGVPGNE